MERFGWIREIVGLASSKLVPVVNVVSPFSSLVHTPFGPLKSLMPADVDIYTRHWCPNKWKFIRYSRSCIYNKMFWFLYKSCQGCNLTGEWERKVLFIMNSAQILHAPSCLTLPRAQFVRASHTYLSTPLSLTYPHSLQTWFTFQVSWVWTILKVEYRCWTN